MSTHLAPKVLRVLQLEDSALDCELIQEQLGNPTNSFLFEVVSSKEMFLATYQRYTYDLVLADFSLPGFDALTALKLLRAHDSEVPFICISGAIGEERAVELLKEGATDYVSKSRLDKLPLAVNRALAEVDERFSHRQAEQKLRLSEERYQSLVRTSMDGFLVVDMSGRIQEVNDAVCLMLGVSKYLLLSMTWVELARDTRISDFFDDFDEILDQGWKRFETTMNHANQSAIEVQVSAVHILNQGIIVCFISNIGERKTYEKKIEKALREKETLIRELYHRTKNTIQVVRSLMELQATDHPENADLQRLVKATDDRIRSISLVHQLLYHSRDLSRISLGDYVRELADSVLKSYGILDQRIRILVEIDDRHVLLDTAVPFGLILNELITNSLKHGFPHQSTGTLSLFVGRGDSTDITFRYQDDGIGVPAGFDFRNQETLGLRLIFSLGEEQLAGRVTMEGGAGVKFTLVFSNDLYQTRL